jgi:hypothetical protein
MFDTGAAGDLVLPPAAPKTASATPDRPTSYVVQPGDTIWSVARRLKPEGDLRPVVDELVSANGGAALEVGQILQLNP